MKISIFRIAVLFHIMPSSVSMDVLRVSTLIHKTRKIIFQAFSPPKDTSALTDWFGKTENITFISKSDPVSLMNRLIGFHWKHYKFTIGVFLPWKFVLVHHGDGEIVANHLLFLCVNLVETYEYCKHKYHK